MQPPTIRQLDPSNAKTFDLEVQLAERRYEYLVGRRDQMSDRIRTGSLALNGSSLVAILATLSGDGTAARWIGLTPSNTTIVAAFFVVGAALSGASIILANNQYVEEACDAFCRMLAARRVASAYEAVDDASARTESSAALADLRAKPLVDFQFSFPSIVLQNCGAGAWLVGMCTPLVSAMF